MAELDVTSEVAGVVFTIDTTPGARVAGGDLLLVLESMKMEIAMNAPADGTVTEILVEEGMPVLQGQALLRLRT
ncbi:acetyl-CoA carboxylase biotin carboxyl carrier protein subunit [Azospirillum sp. RWY-5-1]|uniref:Acetyl-CoA carboxylase biotin carboxyl carrier protein subunit n=1 Tax=Azospirillum oleiclasticum TaxID=2735135 RepID=A0ABX2TID8_9PROT|nr:acetyl-CoA carboxylase biotin carboxyl carrier protein subunit [Azospirillum oleiclasticum]NYZ16532.1 acetyl-CoA carboxylase biotin carboxyl carrier protein subunit [Azospirillum oleiclasticum]NYZ23998.1 acetyl-CoA carboxylase biotin carboxyl carrier protein subunit [Azospirillum oleiclasticum]